MTSQAKRKGFINIVKNEGGVLNNVWRHLFYDIYFKSHPQGVLKF